MSNYNTNNYNNYYVQPQSNGVSIASLVCGIISFFCCNPLYLVSVAAVVLGIVGICKRNSSTGMAVVGLILGALSVIICIVIDILLIPVTFGASFFF